MEAQVGVGPVRGNCRYLPFRGKKDRWTSESSQDKIRPHEEKYVEQGISRKSGRASSRLHTGAYDSHREETRDGRTGKVFPGKLRLAEA